MSHTLRHTAGLAVLGAWGWLPNQTFAQTTPVRTMRVLVLNTAGALAAVLSEAEKAADRAFQAAGIESTWRHAGTGTVDDDLTSMIIITGRGSADQQQRLSRDGGPRRNSPKNALRATKKWTQREMYYLLATTETMDSSRSSTKPLPTPLRGL